MMTQGDVGQTMPSEQLCKATARLDLHFNKIALAATGERLGEAQSKRDELLKYFL